MVKMERFQHRNEHTAKNKANVMVEKKTALKSRRWVKVEGSHGAYKPDHEFLIGLCRLQDMDEVFQVVHVPGPGQPATHGTHHLHRRRHHVLMLQVWQKLKGLNSKV